MTVSQVEDWLLRFNIINNHGVIGCTRDDLPSISREAKRPYLVKSLVSNVKSIYIARKHTPKWELPQL